MSNLIASILKCRIEGNTVFLPVEVLPNYQELKTAMLKAGGKYKKNSFVFNSDPSPIIERLTSGQSVNIKKEFQFYPTPSDIAYKLVQLAELNDYEEVLEPSAGQGAIVDAILADNNLANVSYCELMPEHSEFMLGKAIKLANDFMELPTSKKFDKVIANPPFNKSQDVMHIQKMYKHLKTGPNRILISIASVGWMQATQGAGKKFREWLDDKKELSDIDWHRFCNIGLSMQHERANGDIFYVEILEPDAFKESGANVRTCIIKIRTTKRKRNILE